MAIIDPAVCEHPESGRRYEDKQTRDARGHLMEAWRRVSCQLCGHVLEDSTKTWENTLRGSGYQEAVIERFNPTPKRSRK